MGASIWDISSIGIIFVRVCEISSYLLDGSPLSSSNYGLQIWPKITQRRFEKHIMQTQKLNKLDWAAMKSRIAWSKIKQVNWQSNDILHTPVYFHRLVQLWQDKLRKLKRQCTRHITKKNSTSHRFMPWDSTTKADNISIQSFFQMFCIFSLQRITLWRPICWLNEIFFWALIFPRQEFCINKGKMRCEIS